MLVLFLFLFLFNGILVIFCLCVLCMCCLFGKIKIYIVVYDFLVLVVCRLFLLSLYMKA